MEDPMLHLMNYIMPIDGMGMGCLAAIVAKIALELVVTVLAGYVSVGV